MLLLFGETGEPVDAYVVYNFMQIKDTALLVTFQDNRTSTSRTLLIKEDDKWIVCDSIGQEVDQEFVRKVGNFLSSVSLSDGTHTKKFTFKDLSLATG